MKQLVVVVGPTAVGKSALALHLARMLGGEIVGADSRQVFRYMDIGTAKPTAKEMAEVPHHLIDIIDPDEEFTLAQYQEMAYRTIADIQQRGRIPFLVGGTGLYVRAVVEGLQIPEVPPNAEFRRKLEDKASKEGFAALFTDLEAVDPVAALKIDPRNIRRVIRALEVFHSTGVPFSAFARKQPPPYEILILGVTLPRERLYERIDLRVDKMVADGLALEVERLIGTGYSFDLPSMSGLGYRQMSLYLRGEFGLPETIQLIKNETHRFARQQYTWFRLDDPKIHWLQAEEGYTGRAIDEMSRYLEGLVV